MAPQYIFPMHRLTKALSAGQDGAQRRHARRSSPARRSACSATTARASRRCCGSWPGVDKEFRGDAHARPRRDRRAARAGAAARRDQGRARQRRGRRRRDARRCSTASTSWPPNYSDETADEFAACRTEIDAADAWNLDTQLDVRDGRAAPAARRRRRHQALRRRAPPRRAVPPAARARPTCCCSTSPPTTSTPSRSAWLERHLAEYQGTVVAVTHDRYFLDNVAGWILELDRGRGIPYEGNYSSWLEQKQERLAAGGAPGGRAPAHDRRRARVGAPEPQGPPRPRARRAWPTTRRCSPRSATSSSTRSRSTSRPGRGSATWWSRPTACARASATGC